MTAAERVTALHEFLIGQRNRADQTIPARLSNGQHEHHCTNWSGVQMLWVRLAKAAIEANDRAVGTQDSTHFHNNIVNNLMSWCNDQCAPEFRARADYACAMMSEAGVAMLRSWCDVILNARWTYGQSTPLGQLRVRAQMLLVALYGHFLGAWEASRTALEELGALLQPAGSQCRLVAPGIPGLTVLCSHLANGLGWDGPTPNRAATVRLLEWLESAAQRERLPDRSLATQAPPAPGSAPAIAASTAPTSAESKRVEVKAPAIKRGAVPKLIKDQVWDLYVGRDKGLAKCWACGYNEISSKNFECGHVQARAKGGEDSVPNLRPVCGSCNKSMGTRNMDEYKAALAAATAGAPFASQAQAQASQAALDERRAPRVALDEDPWFRSDPSDTSRMTCVLCTVSLKRTSVYTHRQLDSHRKRISEALARQGSIG